MLDRQNGNVGGSRSICLYRPQAKTWTYVLEEYMVYALASREKDGIYHTYTGAQKGKLEVGKITWPAITYGYAVSAFFSYHTMAYEILYPCRVISSYRK